MLGCKNLESLPENFILPSGITNAKNMFMECSSLKKLPDNFILPSDLTGSLTYFFSECSSLEALPDGFTIPEGVTDVRYMFKNCQKIECLPESFAIPKNYSGAINHMFYNCSNLQTIPNNFEIPEGVTNITYLFGGNKKLKGLITIKGNPNTYAQCFYNTAIDSASTLTVNYSSNCTNIDDILATGNSTYVVKGSQID